MAQEATRLDRREGDARVVVDGHMQVLAAGALDRVAAIAGDAVRRPDDADQLLDVQVQQIARSGMYGPALPP
jgi:hypothetical protein